MAQSVSNWKWVFFTRQAYYIKSFRYDLLHQKWLFVSFKNKTLYFFPNRANTKEFEIMMPLDSNVAYTNLPRKRLDQSQTFHFVWRPLINGGHELLESGPIPDRVVVFSAINHGWAFKEVPLGTNHDLTSWHWAEKST